LPREQTSIGSVKVFSPLTASETTSPRASASWAWSDSSSFMLSTEALVSCTVTTTPGSSALITFAMPPP
jgi:hypothetical protein